MGLRLPVWLWLAWRCWISAWWRWWTSGRLRTMGVFGKTAWGAVIGMLAGAVIVTAVQLVVALLAGG